MPTENEPHPSSRAPNGGALHRLSSLRISHEQHEALKRCRSRLAAAAGLPAESVTEASVLRLAIELGLQQIELGRTGKGPAPAPDQG